MPTYPYLNRSTEDKIRSPKSLLRQGGQTEIGRIRYKLKWYRLGLAAMYWMRKFAAPIPTVRHVTLLLPMFPIYVYPPTQALLLLSRRPASTGPRHP